MFCQLALGMGTRGVEDMYDKSHKTLDVTNDNEPMNQPIGVLVVLKTQFIN